MGSGDTISFRAAADQAIEELGPYFGVTGCRCAQKSIGITE